MRLMDCEVEQNLGLTPRDARRGLPRPVGVGIRRSSDGPAPGVFPGEEDILGPRALEQRRTYFALGRAAARDALAVSVARAFAY